MMSVLVLPRIFQHLSSPSIAAVSPVLSRSRSLQKQIYAIQWRSYRSLVSQRKRRVRLCKSYGPRAHVGFLDCKELPGQEEREKDKNEVLLCVQGEWGKRGEMGKEGTKGFSQEVALTVKALLCGLSLIPVLLEEDIPLDCKLTCRAQNDLRTGHSSLHPEA